MYLYVKVLLIAFLFKCLSYLYIVNKAHHYNTNIMTLSNITFKQVISSNTINNSLQESTEEVGLLDIENRFKPNCFKCKMRRFFQTFLNSSQRESIVILNSVGVRQKKFKNKTIIEVSNPQTDYRFYQRI